MEPKETRRNTSTTAIKMPTATSNGLGASRAKDPNPGGHALASAKFQPDGKHVSQDREKRGHASQQIPSGEKGTSECYRGQSFERIENQRQHAQCGRRAGDVGCADVAAAGLPDVLSAKNAHQNKAKGDRSQKVTESGREKELMAHQARAPPPICNAGKLPS